MSDGLATGPGPSTGDVVEGPSYPNGVKGLAIMMVLLIVALGSGPGAREAAAGLPLAGQLLALAALAVVFTQLWALLRSRTRIDATTLSQGGPWRRQVALNDVVQLRLLRLRGLEWIVTPRLVVRSRSLAPTTFTAGDAALLDAFERLVRDGLLRVAER